MQVQDEEEDEDKEEDHLSPRYCMRLNVFSLEQVEALLGTVRTLFVVSAAWVVCARSTHDGYGPPGRSVVHEE